MLSSHLVRHSSGAMREPAIFPKLQLRTVRFQWDRLGTPAERQRSRKRVLQLGRHHNTRVSRSREANVSRGGSMVMAKTHGNAYTFKLHQSQRDSDATIAPLIASYHASKPIPVILGTHVNKSATRSKYPFSVLGWYAITHMWVRLLAFISDKGERIRPGDQQRCRGLPQGRVLHKEEDAAPVHTASAIQQMVAAGCLSRPRVPPRAVYSRVGVLRALRQAKSPCVRRRVHLLE